MCKDCTKVMALPLMAYEEPQKVCTRCVAGAPASRFLKKVPVAKRTHREKSKAKKGKEKTAKGAKDLASRVANKVSGKSKEQVVYSSDALQPKAGGGGGGGGK
eukprot:SAG22_NODE_1677_length_3828_cov_2.539019_2_plen_103_part_00